MEAIKARLLEEGSDSMDYSADTTVQGWDFAYLKRIQDGEHKIDHKATSVYLPFKETTAAILRNVTGYLQLWLEAVEREELVGCIWSNEVDVWAVWDEGDEAKGQFVGYLCGDLLDRPKKYKHNQTVELQGSFLREDGSRQYPSALLMCSFSPDVVDGCKVLEHSNIITIYHGKWGDSHGCRVCLEFGEGIGTTTHHAAILHLAYSCMTMCCSADATFDMAVHNPKTHQDLEALDETKLFQLLKAQSEFTPAEKSLYPQASFSHLVSGYNSGYYAYVCSNVFGEEIFQSNFAADPTSTVAWNQFRRQLLEYGGSRDQTVVLNEFLGRPPTSTALLKSLGIE